MDQPITIKPIRLGSVLSFLVNRPFLMTALCLFSRYGMSFQQPLPFPAPSRPLYSAQALFPPSSYPTSSLNRYRSSSTGPPLPVQQFPPYSQVAGGTVMGVPVSRSSLLEQVVPTNHFPPRQQFSSSCPSDGAVTFSTPPLLVVTPPPVKSGEKQPAKPKPLVPIAPRSEAPKVAVPFPRLQAGASGATRGFGSWSIPHKGGGVVAGFPGLPVGKAGGASSLGQADTLGPPRREAIPKRTCKTPESKQAGSNMSGFRQFNPGENQALRELPQNPAPGGGSGGSPCRPNPASPGHSPAVLDSRYLEQLYGAFVEPVMVTDQEHRLLWSNAAFKTAADQSQAAGTEGAKSETALEKAAVPSQGASALGAKSDTGPQSNLTAEEGTVDGLGVRQTPELNPSSNKLAIPVPISSIQFQGSSQPASCAAILWVFLKQSGLVPSLVTTPPAPNPPNPADAPKAPPVSPALSAAALPAGDVCSPLDRLFSNENDSSSGSSSSTSSFTTATSREYPGGRPPGEKKAPGRVVTPQPLRPVGSTIRFEYITPLASDASLAVKGSFELIKRQFDRWATPVILTDLKNRARWVNAAYKKLVGQPPCTWLASAVSKENNLEQLRLTGGISVMGLEDLKTLPASLQCNVKVSWPQGGGGQLQESGCMGTRIDSVGSEVLGYLWRFDVPLRGQTTMEDQAKARGFAGGQMGPEGAAKTEGFVRRQTGVEGAATAGVSADD
jgi:hypothetical protein